MPEPRRNVLVVDDDAAVGKVITGLLEQAQIDARHVKSGADALAVIGTMPFDTIISDIRMPGMDGMELLARVNREHPGIPVVMMTAHATVAIAVEAMKLGARDFVLKPFDRDELLFVVQKAIATARETAPPAFTDLSRMVVGTSGAMSECVKLIARVAPSKASVLVRGESGTGKELAARALHDQSGRKQGPFVAIQCGALPESLLEAELFGYEKGAFTGAANRKPGRFELADGGTLFLDEIGDVSVTIQAKLLRVLQEREVHRLGGTRATPIDVRIVAATHRDLEARIVSGDFREDLFFRLSVVPIWLPPLRERSEDIGPLARRFCAVFAEGNGRPGVTLTEAAIALLVQQRWPGNIRELQNFIERLVVLAGDDRVDVADVERELRRGPLGAPAATVVPRPVVHERPSAPGGEDDGAAVLLGDRVRSAERAALVDALARAHDNRTLAARILGVSRRKLYNLLEEHKLA